MYRDHDAAARRPCGRPRLTSPSKVAQRYTPLAGSWLTTTPPVPSKPSLGDEPHRRRGADGCIGTAFWLRTTPTSQMIERGMLALHGAFHNPKVPPRDMAWLANSKPASSPTPNWMRNTSWTGDGYEASRCPIASDFGIDAVFFSSANPMLATINSSSAATTRPSQGARSPPSPRRWSGRFSCWSLSSSPRNWMRNTSPRVNAPLRQGIDVGRESHGRLSRLKLHVNELVSGSRRG